MLSPEMLDLLRQWWKVPAKSPDIGRSQRGNPSGKSAARWSRSLDPLGSGRSWSPARSGTASATSQFVHRLKLHLLDFCQPLPLPRNEVIHLLMEMPDFEIRLKIDSIFVL